MNLSATEPGSEQTEEPFPGQSRGRRFVSPLPLLIARLGIADRQQGVVVLEPDPIADGRRLREISARQPQTKLCRSPKQNLHHLFPISTGSEGLIGLYSAIKSIHKKRDPPADWKRS